MGAFLLYNKIVPVDLPQVLSQFTLRGFKEPHIQDLGQYELLLFKKTHVNHQNFQKNGASWVFATGTYIYKNLSISNSLKQIHHDFLSGILSYSEIKGNYTILIYHNNSIKIFKDPENLYNLYYSSDRNILSSSFLAVITAMPCKLSYNLPAIKELLITGSLIGPETIVNEIFRYEKFQSPEFSNIEWIDTSYQLNYEEVKHDLNPTEVQLNHLKSYFKQIENVIKETNCDLGLTGGFDSRLLLGLVNEIAENPIYYSHNRKGYNQELSLARELANIMNLHLDSPEVISPFDMSGMQLKQQLTDSLLYLDGHIRANAFWTENYNTIKYREFFAKKSGLALNGIGGEQYRNGERILFKKKISSWYYFENAYKFTGNLFFTNLEKHSFLKSLDSKVNRHLKNINLKRYSRKNIKIFLNEVYNTAGRCLRLSVENQATFCLAPFTDYKVSRLSYQIAHHLGLSKAFECSMINRLGGPLGTVYTTYGFKPFAGEPVSSKMLTIFKEIIPPRLYYHLLFIRRKKDTQIAQLKSILPEIEVYYKNVQELDLHLNIDRLIESRAHSPNIISLGFFMEYFSEKITHDKEA